ncbi:MAG: hypothetical protein JKX73_00345 [Flavobacteriales bacterium]|nr:hypothetical protein [Flavobacteriales bacterium]
MVGHGGTISGYTANFVFEKQTEYGVILMRNYNWGYTDLKSRSEALVRKLKELDDTEGKNKEIEIDKKLLDVYTGEYALESDNPETLTITPYGNQLVAVSSWKGKILIDTIWPTQDSTFCNASNAKLRFYQSEDEQFLEWHQGVTYVYIKKK